APRQRVLLVSLDALRPEVYLDAKFDVPNLRAIAARGVTARKVQGVFPTLTYPSHTAIATGCRPARSGIVMNTVFDAEDGSRRWYFEAAHLGAMPICAHACRASRTPAALL